MSSVTSLVDSVSPSNLSVQLDEYHSRAPRTSQQQLSRSAPVAGGGGMLLLLHRGLGERNSSTATSIRPGDEDEGNCVDQPPVYINAAALDSVGVVAVLSPRTRKKTSGRLAIALHSGSAQIPLPDLSVSPLTASSFHTMEKHYDQDTWRMHNRIAASRSERKSYLKQLPSQDSIQSAVMMSYESEILTGGVEDQEDDDDEDALCIFDFDE